MTEVRSALALVDGSPQDGAVVGIACDLVRGARGIVWLLYVIDVPRRLPVDAEIPAETARGEQALQRMESLGKQLKCRVEGEILQAREVGAAIIREALDRGVDAIVFGIPYMERYGSPTLGETAPYILRHSPCAVVVHRDEQAEAGR
jgi:nucleotide-binding universal stress UspA family protein